MIKLAGLWKSKGKDGKQFLSGNLGPGVKLLVFQNTYKKESNHPDYLVYIAPVERKENGQAQHGGGQARQAGLAGELLENTLSRLYRGGVPRLV